MFGTVEPWSLAIMEVACILLFVCWIFAATRDGSSPLRIVKPPFLVPLVVLVGLAFFQLIPLPPLFVKMISPETYRVYREAASDPDSLSWLTLSLYPHATLLEAVRIIAYVFAYFVVLQVLRDGESVLRMATAILGAGVLVALTGILQVVSWNGKLLWFRPFVTGAAFGPYVNRNHFAGLMEMVIPLSVGLGIYLLPSARRGGGFKAAASDLLTHMHANRLILTITGVTMMITALFLSLSRGGIVGLTVSMVFFGTMLSLRGSTRRKGWTIASIFLLVLFSVGWFGWKPVVERFESTPIKEVSADFRVMNWKDSLEIAQKYPLFGTGLGTYEYVYPRYKTILSTERWEHAHNDYIEEAVELGLPGFAAAIYIVVSFYLLIIKSLRKRRSLGPRLLGIGGMAGITGILIHSFTDFNLHVGANGLFFAVLFGFSIAASHMKMSGDGQVTLLEVKEVIVPPSRRMRLRLTLAAVCAFFFAVAFSNALADGLYRIVNGSTTESNDLLTPKAGILKTASLLSPLDARYPFAMGNIDLLDGKKEEAVGNYERAVSLDPLNGEYLQMLGVGLEGIGRSEMADRYLRLAVKNDSTSAWRHKNFALWLFSKGRRDEGMGEMKKAISLDASNTRQFITAMVLSGLDQAEIKSVISENPESLIFYGNYREAVGDREGALESYLDALATMKKRGTVRPDLYRRIAVLYEKRGFIERGIAIYEEGIRELPSNYDLRIGLAGLYEKTNEADKAIAQYKYALELNPSGSYAENRLEKLKEK
jgi:tetratricopeptide (TPR) repeat protein